MINPCNEKGWMIAEMLNDLLRTTWLCCPEVLLSNAQMLVVDTFKGHTIDVTNALITDNRSDLIVIPRWMTSHLQPLGVCLNKPVQNNVHKCYGEWMEQSGHTLPTERLK